MRKELTITTAVAAALMAAGCDRRPPEWTAQQDTAICTDRQGKRVPDRNCEQRGHGAYGGNGASSAFMWYFLGRNSQVPYYGEAARGGSYSGTTGRSYFRAPSGSAMTRSAAISRGGFGSSAHSFSSAHS
ncbi:hypothetical protein [uncultured Sphingomonas sp.]|uniref:hypothetical protein n=1 Tax=uncultured Sphingomonas sp. TaxID=158754 RepID=UPI0025FC7CED|nr:hypothetical protein [uncultured Sphingomonas sp.]